MDGRYKRAVRFIEEHILDIETLAKSLANMLPKKYRKYRCYEDYAFDWLISKLARELKKRYKDELYGIGVQTLETALFENAYDIIKDALYQFAEW